MRWLFEAGFLGGPLGTQLVRGRNWFSGTGGDMIGEDGERARALRSFVGRDR